MAFRHKPEQLTGRNAGIRQRGTVVVDRLLVSGVRIGCRERFDLSICSVVRPCRAVLIGGRSAGDVVFDLGHLTTGSIIFKPGFRVLRIECRKHFAVIVVTGRADEDRVGASRDCCGTGEGRSAIGAVVG